MLLKFSNLNLFMGHIKKKKVDWKTNKQTKKVIDKK